MDEGYVKYVAERRDGIVPHSAQLDELNQARTALFDLGLIGVYPDGVGYGNLSFRNSGNQFVITASATGTYSVEITLNGCVASDVINVTVLSATSLNIGADATIFVR